MSIQEMKEYLDLCLKGESTIPQRQEMLTKTKGTAQCHSGTGKQRRLYRLEAKFLR